MERHKRMNKFFRYWLLNQLPFSAIIIYILISETNYWVAWIIGNNFWILFSYLICEKNIFEKHKNWKEEIVKK